MGRICPFACIPKPIALQLTYDETKRRGKSMLTKLLITYDVNEGTVEEYRQFVTGEFLPAVQKMGLAVTEVWHTAYGDYPDRMTELVSRDKETMQQILNSEEWDNLESQLRHFVSDFNRKVVPYRPGFQL
jgi:hypothetical protein